MSLPIQSSEAAQLSYLSAYILEGLRKHSSVAQLRERMISSEGDWILDYRISGGTYIDFNKWGLQLNEIFGDDSGVYRPERWLIDEIERLKFMRRVLDLVFGHDSTMCLDIIIVMIELNKIFFEICSNQGSSLWAKTELTARCYSSWGISISSPFIHRNPERVLVTVYFTLKTWM